MSVINIQARPRHWTTRWKKSSLCLPMSRMRLRPRFWRRSPTKTPGSGCPGGKSRRFGRIKSWWGRRSCRLPGLFLTHRRQ